MSKHGRGIVFFLFLVATALAGAQAFAGDTVEAVIAAMSATRSLWQAAISPDGARVAWVEEVQGPNGSPSRNRVIRVAEIASGRTARVTAGEAGKDYIERDLAWSPDSRKLAFLSDAQSPGQLQLHVAEPGGGAPRKLTSLKGYLRDLRWSPDGKSIALLFTEDAPRELGPLQPMLPDAGVKEEHIYEQRLAVVDAASGAVRQVSPADMYVYEYDWSPDGKRFATIAAHGSGDNNWWIAQLYTLDSASGEMRSILKPSLQIAVPRWSPDGKSIACIGGLMSDQGVTGGDIFLVPAEGGTARNLTPGLQASPSWMVWQSPERLLFAENADGNAAIAALNLSSGEVSTLWTGEESIRAEGWMFAFSLAQDGNTSAVIRSSSASPPEVWAGPIGQWRQLSHVNQGASPAWGQVKSLHWKNEGQRAQGWLMLPREYDPQKRYPLVVEVHGGPAGACVNGWPQRYFGAPLSGSGYFVLCPNPRGSYGQGEAFTQGNVKDFGYGDLRDILAGVDEVLKEYPVDAQRLGIVGWSYGGFMTMWTVTQTGMFRAAVAGAGIANWESYYGENDIDQWMIPYFGASVYDDPAVYARSSPITFIKKVRTPTLILVGDRDGEVPAPQSYEFWHALKTLGVPAQLVVYPNEGHNISQPQHRRDIMQRTVAWFDRYVKAPSAQGKPQ